ncbi:TonB-dependent receptor [Sphingosinicellaceae bacterium]|nr:TonB-dependent receptor [Sphingosinicellaceae bacterium]
MTRTTQISYVALAFASLSVQSAGAQTVAAAQTTAAATDDSSEIIVTGTRAVGTLAVDSAAPIKIVGADAIGHVGQPNLNQVLTQLVPSFTAQGFGGDTANLTLSASLRGLNPNETLVLVNGKRRHGTANLQILAGAFQGGAAPDLDFITPASIDHIEVLEDGASAQYGSDAIAGVINVIMKSGEGGELSATAGQYYGGDGLTYSASANYGIKSERGFLNVTGFYRYHDFSNAGKYDIRIYDPATGGVPAGTDPALATALLGIKGYPNLNRVVGDARSKFGVASYNGGYDITDGVQAYSFGSYGVRRAESYENYRLPNRVVGSTNVGEDGLFLPGTYGAPDALVPRPEGFKPQEALREIDFQFTGGLKGDIGDWSWDLSTTYGSDRTKIKTLDSLNPLLYTQYHDDQSDFYDGLYKATEWTSNLDITHDFTGVGTLAGGAEYRRNTYEIGAGEPNSYYGTGAQSFPGFNPLAAGKHNRNNYAFYGDFLLTAIENLKLDGAVRYEHYSDFGSRTTFKVTGRYDFTPTVAVRGTVATGFRAPTLAEEQYTAVNVAPGSATAQLAANSNASKVLGIPNLEPEKSTNYSAGVVLRPARHLVLTVDAYQIKLRDRIIGSGSISADTSNPADPVAAAIKAAGVVLEADLPAFVSAFINGPDTRTRGIDVVASYDTDFGNAGKAVFTLSAAYNKTKITRQGIDPAIVAATGQTLYNAQTDSFLTTSVPHLKLIAGVNWSLGDFTVVARETFYSKSVALLYNDNDPAAASSYAYSKVGSAGITDLEVDYKLTKQITLAAGANNLFNKRPEKVRFDADGILSGDSAVGGAPYQFGPYGINGGYYYGRVTFAF